MMQHRTQKLTTKFQLQLSFRLAEKEYWNFHPKAIVEWIISKRQPKIFAPTLAQEIKNQFLNPPMGNTPITEENGPVTIGAS